MYLLYGLLHQSRDGRRSRSPKPKSRSVVCHQTHSSQWGDLYDPRGGGGGGGAFKQQPCSFRQTLNLPWSINTETLTLRLLEAVSLTITSSTDQTLYIYLYNLYIAITRTESEWAVLPGVFTHTHTHTILPKVLAPLLMKGLTTLVIFNGRFALMEMTKVVKPFTFRAK